MSADMYTAITGKPADFQRAHDYLRKNLTADAEAAFAHLRMTKDV